MERVKKRNGHYVELVEENLDYVINFSEDIKVIINRGSYTNETDMRRQFETSIPKNACFFHFSESEKINLKVAGLVVPLEANQIVEIGTNINPSDIINYGKLKVSYDTFNH